MKLSIAKAMQRMESSQGGTPHNGLLQRTCTCGNSAGPTGQCEECTKKDGLLQRRSFGGARWPAVPPIVHEVLRSSGQPLDHATRAFFEAGFGYDFSKVRVHRDARSAESAQAVNALAYTVGNDLVFGPAQYSPGSAAGRKLLAHELAHVIQQRRHPSRAATTLQIANSAEPAEAEAETAAETVVQRQSFRPALLQTSHLAVDLAASQVFDSAAASNGPSDSPNLPAARLASEKTARRGPPIPIKAVPSHWVQWQEVDAISGGRVSTKPSEFPGFSQGDYVTCGAASVVSALMIWDREKHDPKAPNDMVVNTCNLILSYLASYGPTVRAGWKGRVKDPDALYQTVIAELKAIREFARLPGSKLAESQYQSLGLALYVLHFSGPGGLSKADIESTLNKLGLTSTSSATVQSFDDLFNTSLLKGLQTGQVAQALWYAVSGPPDAQGKVPLTMHAFLIGRFQRGPWFVSDQGSKPPLELEAPDLNGLKTLISIAAKAGRSVIYTGGPPSQFIVGGWTGVQLLGERGGLEKKAENLLPAGSFLAEVDAGAFTSGSRITADSFVSREYDRGDALAKAKTTGKGAAIVEMPQEVYNVYSTSLVSAANVKETSIDAADSKGGLLGDHRFYHAWLLLANDASGPKTIFQVY